MDNWRDWHLHRLLEWLGFHQTVITFPIDGLVIQWFRGRVGCDSRGFVSYNEGGLWFTAWLGWRKSYRRLRLWFCPPVLAPHIGRYTQLCLNLE